jgi:predicted aconitase
MQLTAGEQAMLDGSRGEALRAAMALQVAVGEFYGAERMVAIGNAHMMGDIEVMGDAGLAHRERLRAAGARPGLFAGAC